MKPDPSKHNDHRRLLWLLAMAALLAITAEACGSNANPAATTTTTAGRHRVGDTVSTTLGRKLTLHAWKFPAQVPGPQPAAGARFGAADLEVCQESGQSRSFSFGDFKLHNADGTSSLPENAAAAAFGGDVVEPALRPTTLAPGNCARGWVTFLVQASEVPEFLEFAPLASRSSIEWALR